MAVVKVEEFWFRLRGLLDVFARKVVAADPTLVCDTGHTSNAAFLLRAYFAFRRQSDGDEISFTVDVRNTAQRLSIDSDVCTADGALLASGPVIEIDLREPQATFDAALDNWVREFEQFLSKNESMLAKAISQLT